MHLYVANASKQDHDFAYRVEKGRAARTQKIRVGHQIKVSGDLDVAVANYIIEQHLRYGMIAAADVNKVTGVAPLCYSTDGPVPAHVISKLMQINAAILVQKGKELRKEAALASNTALESSVAESHRPERLRALEISVVEENPDERNETPPIAEGFRVEDEKPKPSTFRQRKRS